MTKKCVTYPPPPSIPCVEGLWKRKCFCVWGCLSVCANDVRRQVVQLGDTYININIHEYYAFPVQKTLSLHGIIIHISTYFLCVLHIHIYKLCMGLIGDKKHCKEIIMEIRELIVENSRTFCLYAFVFIIIFFYIIENSSFINIQVYNLFYNQFCKFCFYLLDCS